jgi:amino acid permease
MLEDQTLNMTLQKQKKAIEKQAKSVKKMNEFETFIAIIKGYCGAVILFCPKAFGNGGYLHGMACLAFSGVFTTICAKKLI